MRPRTSLLGFVLTLGVAAGGLSQQVQLTTPYHSINDSFYENFGVGWGGINRMGPGGGWFFRGLPANSTPPPFGGYDPGADARFGFRAGPFGLNFVAGQGSTRSHVMQAPTVVVPNGGTGYFFDGSISPFVMGVVPVVGSGMSPPISPLAERLDRLRESGGWQPQAPVPAPAAPAQQAAGRPRQPAPPAADEAPLVIKAGQVVDSSPGTASAPAAASTATHGDLSLADIRRQQEEQDAARQHEILALIEKARGKEAEGKPHLARIYYQQAASRADGSWREQLLAKVQALSD